MVPAPEEVSTHFLKCCSCHRLWRERVPLTKIAYEQSSQGPHWKLTVWCPSCNEPMEIGWLKAMSYSLRSC